VRPWIQLHMYNSNAIIHMFWLGIEVIYVVFSKSPVILRVFTTYV